MVCHLGKFRVVGIRNGSPQHATSTPGFLYHLGFGERGLYGNKSQ